MRLAEERGTPTGDHLDGTGIDVDAPDAVAAPSELDGERKPDLAGATH
ncbi:MAG: hypothetical protein R2715_10280 [Ilumatobacteraceae bacterium]